MSCHTLAPSPQCYPQARPDSVRKCKVKPPENGPRKVPNPPSGNADPGVQTDTEGSASRTEGRGAEVLPDAGWETPQLCRKQGSWPAPLTSPRPLSALGGGTGATDFTASKTRHKRSEWGQPSRVHNKGHVKPEPEHSRGHVHSPRAIQSVSCHQVHHLRIFRVLFSLSRCHFWPCFLSPGHFNHFLTNLPAQPFSAAPNILFIKRKPDLASLRLKNLSVTSTVQAPKRDQKALDDLVLPFSLNSSPATGMASWPCKPYICTGPRA